jgi:hypothetical protein
MEIEEKNRIHPDYVQLLSDMAAMASEMAPVIFRYFDGPNPKKHYVYSHVLDAYKGIELTPYLLSNFFIPQACANCRQVLENTALSIVLLKHPEVLSRYVSYVKEKRLLQGKSRHQRLEALKIFFAAKKLPEGKLLEYLDYGWLDEIDNKDIGIEKLIKTAGLGDLLKWRGFFSQVIHLDVTSVDVTLSGSGLLTEQIIYFLAICFDGLSVAFHNDTSFEFVFNHQDLWTPFRQHYLAITEQRRTSADFALRPL